MNSPSATPALPERFLVRGEIDRGGMGAVWRVVDRQFDRPLAVKVMLPKHLSDSNAVERFNREAQLTGVLQHPAIPPVVERGELADGSPYLSMKLVEGETLAKILVTRPGDDTDLPRLLGVFELVAQAVGYAHSQKVIHRDLKPANIMVGAFGEVHVMDWGMAKQMGERDPGESEEQGDQQHETPIDLEGTVSFVMDGRGNSDTHSPGEGSTLTVAGQVLGTLAYMPPEQARGEGSKLDARADVFALGGILCKILTGRPPHIGSDQMTLYRNALEGDLKDAFAALDTCDCDPELISLCKECLSPAVENRPPDAIAIAERIRHYDEATRARLEAERAERAASEVREIEERKRRRIQLTFAAASIGFLLIAACAAFWYQQQETARRIAKAAEASRLEAEQAARQNQARQNIARAFKQVPQLEAEFQFAAAASLLRQAESELEDLPNGDPLAKQVQKRQRQLKFVEDLDRIRLRKSEPDLSDVRRNAFDKGFAKGPQGAYANAFRAFGFDLLNGNVDAISQRIRDTKNPDMLTAAIDDWLVDERENAELRSRLTQIANSVDTNKTRIALRTALEDSGDIVEILAEAEEALSPKLAELAAYNLILPETQRANEAAEVLHRSLNSHPRDFWLHFYLATWGELGLSDDARGAHLLAAVAIRPQSAVAYHNLGALYTQQRKWREAEWAYRRTLALRPQFLTAVVGLSTALFQQQKFVEAEAVLREAIQLDPKNRTVHGNLGSVLFEQNRLVEAKAAYEQALELDPSNAQSHFDLAIVLQSLNQLDEAEAVFRKALELDPEHARSMNALSFLLVGQKRSAEAEEISNRLIELNGATAKDFVLVGMGLRERGKLAEAVDAFQRAITLDPDDGEPHFFLADLLRRQGSVEEAEAAYRKAIALNSSSSINAMSHCNLGLLLMRNTQRFDEAVEILEQGHALGQQLASWRYPSEQWVAKARRLQLQAGLIQAIEAGGDVPPASPDTLELAMLAHPRLARPKVAVTLYRVLMSDPMIPKELVQRLRPRAAMAAVAAAEAQVQDAALASAYRQDALGWLSESLPHAADEARRNWLTADALNAVRGESLKSLSDSEQEAWGRFWLDVEASLDSSQ